MQALFQGHATTVASLATYREIAPTRTTSPVTTATHQATLPRTALIRFQTTVLVTTVERLATSHASAHRLEKTVVSVVPATGKCGESDHIARSCPKNMRCYNCEGLGHIANNCPGVVA